MPSVKSSSIAVVEDSSTVMTPSLPTLSKASAMRPPISASCAEIVATCAISALPSTSRATSSRRSFTAETAASMPRFSADGAAPAATLRRPSLTMACASTVAVVVPSPGTSLVLVATSLASWAPRFSYGSSSSTSLAIVTPSLVMVGAPHFLSMTTLRPRGPSVTFTALARASTPRSSARRAESSNSRVLAMCEQILFFYDVRPEQRARGRPIGADVMRCVALSALDDGEDVTGGEDEELLAAVLDLGAAVLAVEDRVADLDVERDPLLALVVEAARTDREDLALLGLLLRGVRDDQAGGRRLLCVERLDDDPVLERLDGNRHVLTLPFGNVAEVWNRYVVAGGASHRRRGAGGTLPGWHTHRESANRESRAPVSTRSTRLPNAGGAPPPTGGKPPVSPPRTPRGWVAYTE